MYKYCQLWKVFKRFLHDGTCHNFMHAMIRDGQIHNRSCQQSSPPRTKSFWKGIHKSCWICKYGCPWRHTFSPFGMTNFRTDNYFEWKYCQQSSPCLFLGIKYRGPNLRVTWSKLAPYVLRTFEFSRGFWSCWGAAEKSQEKLEEILRKIKKNLKLTALASQQSSLVLSQ